LTTFTKGGRPKPTAIWGVPDGDRLLVITDDGSWKVKRRAFSAKEVAQEVAPWWGSPKAS